ncbi:TonB-dependent receptor [Agaribacter flavus]|uniref:TonB-dependent receptor n=1 Tax=Agaribacter flavus TaxID=1902781 RepID=A0ABV7FPI4_9ALTE
MSVKNQRFHLNGVCLAVLSALSFSALGQEEASTNEAATADESVEVIQVKGLKASLKKSINDKRFASGVIDTINSEDIGKTTDQNIADALGRVTGVTVVSQDGEGTQITVRGADANQNNITLNGQSLTSTDFSQAVDLSSFSADILSKLEVVKTPSADHDEGSLGASVNLVTVRPLDQVENIRSFTLQGRYNDFSEKENHKIQFSLSEKFLDETLGVALTVYDESNAYRKDQYNASNFVASQVYDQAVDQNGNVLSGVKVIEPSVASYELHQNESNRYGGSLGIQFLPNDVSELMLDVTYSKQELVRTFDAVQAKSFANIPNFVEGVQPTNFSRAPNPFSDPIDWIQVDTRTYDMTKRINRYGNGNLVRSDGGQDNENFSSTLNFKTELSSSLVVEAQVGHSFSKSESLPSAFTVMENFVQVPGRLLYDAGANIEPVGVDCTGGGDVCRAVYGNSLVDLGENLNAFTDENGSRVSGASDNVAFTGFNPQDISSFHLGFISESQRDVEDSITNAQVDFDWFVDDFYGVTKVEFGAKATSRNKLVDNQNFSFQSLQASEVITDPVTGETIVELGGSLSSIRGDIIAGDPIPYDDFMASLGFPREGATVGWTPIDVKLAKELVLGDGDVVRNVDNTASRETDIDTQALYFKVNFEFLDGKLTGDLGVRYVETEIEAQGFSGARYFEQGGSDLQREFDRHTLAQLADRSLAECPAINPGDDGITRYDQKYQRVDGLGWDTSAGPDPATWVRIPDVGPCHDPAVADYADALAAFRAGDIQDQPNLNDFNLLWSSLWRYADVATSRTYGWDNLPEWNGSTDGNNTNYTWGTFENREVASIPAFKTHSYENVLPSLNLNYAFSEEFVGRFAISKTMTRPEIDLLRPGYLVNEGSYWGSGNLNVGNVSVFNTQLEPLESNNLDLSLEWYFSDTGLLSLALFKKDMSNFTDRETNTSFINSVRDPANAPENGDDLILLDSGNLANCHPIRATTEFGYQASDPTTFTGDPADNCADFTVTRVVNSLNAKIQGLELGYVHTYDFLPEMFDWPAWTGGFGVSANYTFQDSEYDSGFSTINPELRLPSYPVAETPEHSYNLTTFWEQNGHQVRLSLRGTSDSLVGTDWTNGQSGRNWNQGSIWNEGRDTLDLSASYQVNENISLTFQAINLTDVAHRIYFTSRTLDVVRVPSDNAAGFDFVNLEEGNPLEGEAPTHRTYQKYKIGTTYRLGLRVKF